MEKRFEAIDGLRAVFGLGIVIYHVNETFGAAFSEVLSPVYAYGGYFGNYLLFMLSGLFTHRHFLEPRPDGFRPYLRERLRRLYPVYALSNLAMMFLGTAALSLQKICATFLMVSTGWFFPDGVPYNLPSWFLCVLLLCYLLYGLLRRVPSAARQGLYTALAAAGAALEQLDLSVPFLYRVCGEGYLNFFLGVLLAERLESLQRNRRTVWGCLGVLLCGTAGLTAQRGFSHLPGDMRWWITLLCAGLIAAALLGGEPVLTLPGLPALGRRSFSLLLWHVPLARGWTRLAGRQLDPRLSFLLYLAAAVGTAFLSYRCLEQPPKERRSG